MSIQQFYISVYVGKINIVESRKYCVKLDSKLYYIAIKDKFYTHLNNMFISYCLIFLKYFTHKIKSLAHFENFKSLIHSSINQY